MTTGSRLPALVLLVLIVVAAALLVAGWGIAVGIGVFVGLVLGFTAILAAMAIAQRSGGSASFAWMKAGPNQTEPDHALLERHGRDSMRVAAIDAGELRRVIAVGASVETGGVRLELIAVELRTDGGLATLVAHTRPPIGQVGHFVEVRVSDDAATAYVAAGQGTGGSGPTATRHEVRFAPAPPDRAEVLTISVDRFVEPFPSGAIPVEGPWTFEVRLGR
ncbi:MAG TPA: hypothetical protein VJL31_00830 [Gemmatimonadales bacterium]|nr:hypothetical protein [Gemmatimonadales bacterium]